MPFEISACVRLPAFSVIEYAVWSPPTIRDAALTADSREIPPSSTILFFSPHGYAFSLKHSCAYVYALCLKYSWAYRYAFSLKHSWAYGYACSLKYSWMCFLSEACLGLSICFLSEALLGSWL
ncbi:hypothetical protein CDAR_237651 [Caerostris darwini]|uniref:Uncharacterized protein n=1 Tax=Caerostris darwini TaxID=1538125 RepID=A0AAV4NH55_9ARAC|nr:hypothetical protein CDAR_237651 [Caerostris darwini]